MKRRKLRVRQRTFLSMRIKIVAVAAVSFLGIFIMAVYFNFYDIQDSNAFSSGDYRTVASGNWEDAASWEVFDGENWTPAMEPPGDGVRKILVGNSQKMVVTDEIPISELIIEEGSQVTLESNTVKISKFNGKGGLICNGTLELGSAILEGNGDFVIGPNARLMIGSDEGIDKKGLTGNVQMTGKKEYHKEATYVYNGSILQHTGSGLPSVVKHLVIDNSSGVILDQQLQILNKLQLVQGHLSTAGNFLTLGNSILTPCSIESDKGTFSGNIRVWFGPQNINQLNFPLSDGNTRQQIGFISGQPVFQKGMIELAYKDGVPDDSQKSPFEARQVVVAITGKGYFSAMLSNGAEEAWLQLRKFNESSSDNSEIIWDINKKTADSVTGITASKNTASDNARVKSISNILYGPVPFTDRLVVRFYSDFRTMTSMQLMSSRGQVVQMENLQVEQGYNQFVFNAPNKLPTGSYMIQISNPSEIHTFSVKCEAGKETLPGS